MKKNLSEKFEKYRLEDGRYYFDNASTTRVNEKSLEAFVNISSQHYQNISGYSDSTGNLKSLYSESTSIIANSIGRQGEEDNLIFTSGATESANLVLHSMFLNRLPRVKIVSSKLEHKCVLEKLNHLEQIGAEVIYVEHDSFGVLDLESLQKELMEEVSFVTIMHVNNETGEINDINVLHDICRRHQVPFVTDITQGLGKFDYSDLNWDVTFASGHKIGSVKGIGFIHTSSDLLKTPLFYGGQQQKGMRPGTINLAAIVSLSVALREYSYSWLECKELFQTFKTVYGIKNVKVLGVNRVPSIYALEFESEDSLNGLIDQFEYSRGSACSSGVNQPSHVYTELTNKVVIRISF